MGWLRVPVLLAAVGLASCAAEWAGREANAQPAPSFRASCEELPAALEKLDPSEAELVVIDVVGKLTVVEFDGALAYLGMCSAPTPNVLCITYSTNNSKVGDTVVLTGAYSRKGPDLVVLDPCLHHLPEQ